MPFCLPGDVLFLYVVVRALENRKYRHITLDNTLQVLLVSDDVAEIGAAALVGGLRTRDSVRACLLHLFGC